MRGLYGGVWVAGLAGAGLGGLHGAGLAERSAAAASRGEWSSAAARAGIWHKAGMVVVVCVAALTDLVLNVAVENLPAFGDGVGFDFEGVVLPVVLVWYIFTELGSIAENGAAMGAPVPSWLLSLLAESKEKAAK